MKPFFNRKTLKQIRKEKGITLNEAVYRAEQLKMNITRATIINNEKGHTKPNIDTLQAYAFIYDVPVSYFFGFKPAKTWQGNTTTAETQKVSN